MAGWSEEAFRARVRARAKELNRPLAQALERAELGHDTLLREPKGRRVDSLERLAVALDWELADIMGFRQQRTNHRLLRLAADAADEVLAKLPQHARTRDRLIKIQADIYDTLVLVTPEGTEPPRLVVVTCIETLAGAFNSDLLATSGTK